MSEPPGLGPLVARLAMIALAGAAVAACGSLPRMSAVPVEKQHRAVVAGMPDVRYRPPEVGGFVSASAKSVQREAAMQRAAGYAGPLAPSHFLALSGGGQDGAFGAGMLVGWTARGDRPEFKLVTGVSTGALMAPFAFLGPSHDERLRRLYTTMSTSDILIRRWFMAALIDDAMADNAPLRNLIAETITQEMIDAIAAESAKGRMLLIATTDLDARRPVIWNITEIAESRHPEALALIHNIMVASAAIPGAFPPVMIDVEADGLPYQEMHVDAGATAQVFLVPPGSAPQINTPRRERHVWLIRNSRLDPDWAETQRNTLTIAQRAIASLIQTQGIGDIFQIHAITQREGADLHIAYVPATFKTRPEELFDRAYMNELFALGFELGRQGYPWASSPPGFGGD